jgi:Predicted Fe-S oxidoreductases
MEAILHKLEALKVVLSMSGGEPFVHKDFMKILSLIHDYGFEVVAIFTNGLLINEATVMKIKDMFKNVKFLISLDGFREEHSAFRRIPPEVYNKIIENIKLLKRLGFKVIVNTMIHKLFTREKIKVFMKFLKTLNIDMWRVDIPLYEGEWRKYYKVFGLDMQLLIDYLCDIILYWIDLGKPYNLELSHFAKILNNTFYISDEYTIDDFVPVKHLQYGLINLCHGV